MIVTSKAKVLCTRQNWKSRKCSLHLFVCYEVCKDAIQRYLRGCGYGKNGANPTRQMAAEESTCFFV